MFVNNLYLKLKAAWSYDHEGVGLTAVDEVYDIVTLFFGKEFKINFWKPEIQNNAPGPWGVENYRLFKVQS